MPWKLHTLMPTLGKGKSIFSTLQGTYRLKGLISLKILSRIIVQRIGFLFCTQLTQVQLLALYMVHKATQGVISE